MNIRATHKPPSLGRKITQHQQELSALEVNTHLELKEINHDKYPSKSAGTPPGTQGYTRHMKKKKYIYIYPSSTKGRNK